MEGTTFAEHYRLCAKGDGFPRELSRTGGAIIYKAKDIRSGEPVTLELIPISSVDPVARERFEEQARAAQLLDHINIAKVYAFGVEDDHFVLVSEYLEGETADSWIAEDGPMGLDAVLRIALQVVSALSAASFHGLTHPAIWPSNLVIVPGPTAEGGWPFVKLVNFALNGFKPASHGGETREAQFASPEQLQRGTVDFRSEIYSLGATMCFLLTGAAPSAGTIPLQQLSRFPKRVRTLLAQMLRNNPDERPQDPVGFAEEIRDCLSRVEQRQALARRFGIPLVSIIPRTSERPQVWVSRRALALAVLALMLAALAATLLPEPIRAVLHRNRTIKTIGVPIGVPEASAAPLAPSPVTTTETKAAPSESGSSPVVPTNQVAPSSTEIAANSDVSEPKPPAEGRDDSAAAPADSASERTSVTQNTNAGADNPSNNAATESASTEAKVAAGPKPPTSTTKRRSTAISRRSRGAQMPLYESDNVSPPLYPGSFRSRVVGTTPDGRLILLLPSGETAVVEPRRRHARRIFMERRERFLPPLQPFDPTFPPVD